MFGKTRYKYYDIISGECLSIEKFDNTDNIIGNIIFDYIYLFLKSNINMKYFYNIKSKFDNTKILNYKLLDNTKSFLNEDFKKSNTNTIIFYDCYNNIDLKYIPKKINKLVFIESEIDNLNNIPSDILLKNLIIWDCKIENLDIFYNYNRKLNITIYGDLPKKFNLCNFNKNIQIKTIIL